MEAELASEVAVGIVRGDSKVWIAFPSCWGSSFAGAVDDPKSNTSETAGRGSTEVDGRVSVDVDGRGSEEEVISKDDFDDESSPLSILDLDVELVLAVVAIVIAVFVSLDGI